MHIRAALEAEFEKQYDNKKSSGDQQFPGAFVLFLRKITVRS